jgi:hypothetical protein
MACGCTGVASPQERAVRDAAAAHLAESGLSLGIADRTLVLDEREEEVSFLFHHCLGEPRQASPDFLRRFFEINRHSVPWSSTLFLKRVTFVSGDEPTDYLQFGLPLIDEANGSALIYVERHCPLCGFGRYILLQRREAGWRVVAECEAWVS